jgi:hypothetical protein
MGLERETERWQGIRDRAISNWNALDYMQACNNLGEEPEFPDLYNSGCAEKSLLLKRAESFESQKINRKKDTYLNFYAEGSQLGRTSLEFGANEKRNLLQKYFIRFSDSGRQSISDYDDAQVGKIFSKIITQAEKELGILRQ